MVRLCLRSENLGTNVIKLCSQSVATLSRQLQSCKTTTGTFWAGSLFGSKPQARRGKATVEQQRAAQHRLQFPQLSQKNREISRPSRRLYYMMQHLPGIFFFPRLRDTEQMAADQFHDKVIIFCFLQMSEKSILSEHVRPRTTSSKAFTHQVCDD